MRKKIYKMTEGQVASILNKKSLLDKEVTSSLGEGLNLDIIPELFSIHEEVENPTFYISKKKEDFGKPMMEKSDDCYHVVVNPEYKDLSFVFEVINDMYENKEFNSLMSESNVVCEECFELAIEKRLTENFDLWVLKDMVSEDVKYHLNNAIPLLENQYRHGSEKHAMVIK